MTRQARPKTMTPMTATNSRKLDRIRIGCPPPAGHRFRSRNWHAHACRPVLTQALRRAIYCKSFWENSKSRLVLANYVSTEEGCERSEEHTSELQSLMRISYAVFCLKKKNT